MPPYYISQNNWKFGHPKKKSLLRFWNVYFYYSSQIAVFTSFNFFEIIFRKIRLLSEFWFYLWCIIEGCMFNFRFLSAFCHAFAVKFVKNPLFLIRVWLVSPCTLIGLVNSKFSSRKIFHHEAHRDHWEMKICFIAKNLIQRTFLSLKHQRHKRHKKYIWIFTARVAKQRNFHHKAFHHWVHWDHWERNVLLLRT